MEQFDFVVIGAGPAGEAAAYLALERGRTVAVVERDLFGGACPFWACMPSKSLLHAAAVHAVGDTYPWSRASARRDYMINREPPRERPDDGSHVHALETAGATIIRGDARLTGPGAVSVTLPDGSTHELAARDVILAVGSTTRMPPIEDLAATDPWSNVQLSATRELPRSLLVLGGGPTGVELGQVFARFGVPVTIIESNQRLLARDHPRNSDAVEAGLARDGVTIRTGVRALKAVAGGGTDGAHRVELGDGTSVQGHRILIAIGRAFPLADLHLDAVGLDPATVKPDGRLRLADGLWLVGDPAGPELHTHVSHYQGEMAVRMALGDDVRPDYTAIPRCTYTDPEAAFTGVTLEQAQAAGLDAVEFTQPIATTAKGYVSETEFGHVSIVVDRTARTLVGAAIAGPPGSTEAIHEAVLAVKTHVPLAVLADTIHAFPTTARVMGTLFGQAAKALA
jgi:pyruvate/2-oxoglutarate dehydrogenase complex dihydrolipoamide dehydrogenase (E3) component